MQVLERRKNDLLRFLYLNYRKELLRSIRTLHNNLRFNLSKKVKKDSHQYWYKNAN